MFYFRFAILFFLILPFDVDSTQSQLDNEPYFYLLV